MEVFDLSDKTERVLLVGVQENDGDDTEESLQELAELAKTAGAEVVGTVIQKRERIHPGTYVGKGKIDEIRTLLNALDATGIICDDELSPVQMNHLQQELESKIMDRTLLILEFLQAVQSRKKERFRLNLPSFVTVRCVWSDLEVPFQDLEAELEQEDQERKNWKWTVV